MSKLMLCPVCHGRRGPYNSVMTCHYCNGSGQSPCEGDQPSIADDLGELVRLRAQVARTKEYAEAYFDECEMLKEANKELWKALQNLYDDCAEYIKINNLYGADGKSAIWNQVMEQARAILERHR